jgi:predicted NBD/HSP70 family sugar kinase
MSAQVLASSQQYRFAFDIGGTFTDLVLLGSDGTIFTSKVLTGAPDVVMPRLDPCSGD